MIEAKRDLLKKIGSRMREAREISGFSQTKAASLIGYKNSSRLNKIECATDVSNISLDVIIRAAKIYDVSIDFLTGRSDDFERSADAVQVNDSMHYILDLWMKQHLNDMNAIRKNENKVKTLCKTVNMYSQSVNECRKSLNLFMAKNKQFDDMPCGAMLVNAVCGAENAIYNATAALKRYKADISVEQDMRDKQLRVFD